MGHANIETTMDIYAEVTDTKKQEAIQKFSTQFRCILGKSPAWTDESTTKMCAIRQEYDKFEWCNQHKYVIIIMLEHRKRLY